MEGVSIGVVHLHCAPTGCYLTWGIAQEVYAKATFQGMRSHPTGRGSSLALSRWRHLSITHCSLGYHQVQTLSALRALTTSRVTQVNTATVLIDGQALDHPEGLLVALNKPKGYTCSHNQSEGKLIYDLIPQQWLARKPGITSVGRWDTACMLTFRMHAQYAPTKGGS